MTGDDDDDDDIIQNKLQFVQQAIYVLHGG